MSRERQRKQSEEVRNKILETARLIVSEEGVDALTVRRITKEMDYSTGIVYHYFESIEQILSCVLQEAYQRILCSIEPPGEDLTPDEALQVSMRRFMEGILQWPDEYMAVMLSASPQVLDFSSVLGDGCVEKRPALTLLASALEAGIGDGLFAPCDARLTAQVIWSAMFGLLTRLNIERDVSLEQRALLIERQIEFILKGLRP